MLPRLILAAALLGLIVWYVGRARNLAPDQRRKHYIKLALAIVAGLLIVLALTGRIHWIGALVGALLPLLRTAAPLVARFIPGLVGKKATAASGSPPDTTTMTRAQALEILGLDEGATEQDIIDAHRRLMQKLHPDRGGNDFLAAQLNRAKDTLLG